MYDISENIHQYASLVFCHKYHKNIQFHVFPLLLFCLNRQHSPYAFHIYVPKSYGVFHLAAVRRYFWKIFLSLFPSQACKDNFRIPFINIRGNFDIPPHPLFLDFPYQNHNLHTSLQLSSNI